MQGQVRQVGLEHIEIHLTFLELRHHLLLQLLHLGHQVKEVVGGEESEVEVACPYRGRCRVLHRLSKEIEGISIDAVAAHSQVQHIHMRIHTEELVHIVGELHVARATCHQDVLAEAHFLHIGKGQVEVEHTLYQMTFQGAVEGQVCLHLVVVSRQS